MVDSATNVREYISNTRIGGLWLATGGLAATEGIRPMIRNSSTARPRASESNRLRDRDAFRSPVLAALPDFMFRLSSDGRYLDFKPAKDLEPYIPPSEFLGRTISDVLPKDIAADGMVLIGRAIETGEMQVYEYQLQLEGKTHQYEARIVPLGYDDVLAIVRDITDDRAKRSQVARRSGDGRTRYGLTKRESMVLRLVTAGMTDKEIGRRLQISPETARKHVANLRRKMGASSRTAAGVRAVKEGLAT